MPGRTSGVKMVGIAEEGAPFSLDEVESIHIIGVSTYVIFTLHQETQKMASKG